MGRRVGSTGVALLALTALACGSRPVGPTVPADAQVVRILVTPAGVHLEPSEVQAGLIHLVLASPTDSVMLFQAAPFAGARPGPLTAEDVRRLVAGDAERTAMSGLDLLGCDAGRRAAEQGRIKVPGGCGDSFPVELEAGLVAFTADDVAGQRPPVDVGVLTVRP